MQNKLSSILQYQLPLFVRDDHEIFVAFVQEYYAWLEEEGRVGHFQQSFKDNMDVDLASDEFVEEFVHEFADTFPKNLLIDKKVLLKTIREFYIAKGSEQSFRFIFTVLYNTDIEIFYPRIFLHRSSDGKFSSNDFAYITGDNFFKLSIDNEDLNATIEGVTSGSQAVIDTVVSTYYDNQLIVKLDISSYNGDFLPNEEIIFTVDDFQVKEYIYGVINTAIVESGGTNYTIDDELTVSSTGDGLRAKAKIKRLSHGPFELITITSGGSGYVEEELVYAGQLVDSPGYGFLGQVYSVDGGGAITAIQILRGGYNYKKKAPAFIKSVGGSGADVELNGDQIGKILDVEVYDSGIDYHDISDITIAITSDEGTGAVLIPDLTGVFNEPKAYINQDDWPSNYSRILDSYYYQHYSYVIASTVSPHKWLGQIKRIAHPAGTQLFGMYRLESEFDVSVDVAPKLSPSLHTILTLVQEQNLTIPGYDAKEITLIKTSESTCGLGLTYTDFDAVKFLDEFDWTIEDYKDLTIRDIITKCVGNDYRVENSTIAIT